MRQDDVPQNKRAFSMEQAKEFFENDYTERLTKTETGRFRGKLHPGEYTPLWDKAVYSESEGVAAYDVDIIADRSMVAIRAEFGPAGAKAERLKVYQKLVVRRNVGSGKMTAYIMSLIPDVGCEDNRIPEKFRSREKNKGGFNGIAVFATTDSGEIVRVQEYRDGKLMRGVYLPNGKGTYIDRCRKAAEILKGTAIMSKRNVMTRAGEDVWDDTWDDDDYSGLDINDLEDLGDGIYTDGYGNYYLDIDLDGDIDLETIAPSYAEGEEGEQEKEEDPWPGGTGDDDGGGSDDGGDDWPEDVPTDGEGNDDDGSADDKITLTANAIISIMGESINSVKNGLTIAIGTPMNSSLASINFTMLDLWQKHGDYEITIRDGLTDIQKELVLSHEFMHLRLLEISQDAGSVFELYNTNQELLTCLNRFGVNAGHHFYMGQHIEETEELLRQAFPDREEEFYEYGKWGGGAFDSDAFNNLSLEEQSKIKQYLYELGL